MTDFSKNQYKISANEFYFAKKNVFVTMDKRDWIAFQKRLLEFDVKYNNAILAFIQDVIKETPETTAILKELASKKFQKDLDRLEASQFVDKAPQIDYSSIDNERIYDEIGKRLAAKKAAEPSEDDETEDF